jgi:cytochrome c biogenesis protein CcmG, thiol:disulfide interchange protein DsbE
MKSKRYEGTKKHQRRSAARKRKNWLPYGLVGLGLLVLVVLLGISFGPAGAQTVIPPRVGAPLSNFSLTDIHGQKVQLSDYAGQVVLVNSWATWCPPCKAEMPDLNAYYQVHQQDGFMVLAINAGDPASSATDFAASHNLAFPVLLDSNLRVLNGFGIHSFPTSIIVSRDGRVKKIHVGMYSPEDLEADITPLLKP